MKDTETNVMIVGVGGQGLLLAGEVLAQAAQCGGYVVSASEVHGIAQRGGSVCSTVRFGPQVTSPVIPEGQVDILLAFEKLEALRYLPQLGPQGVALVNDEQVMPLLESLKLVPYPSGFEETLYLNAPRAWVVPALSTAKELGNPKLTNTIMLGVLSQLLDFPQEAWQNALEQSVPPRTVADNLQAFAWGQDWAKRQGICPQAGGVATTCKQESL